MHAGRTVAPHVPAELAAMRLPGRIEVGVCDGANTPSLNVAVSQPAGASITLATRDHLRRNESACVQPHAPNSPPPGAHLGVGRILAQPGVSPQV